MMPLSTFFLNFKTVFIENPYFPHLWYLLIYVQLLGFYFLISDYVKKWDERTVLLGALVISEISFTLTYSIFKKYPTLVLSSWFFTIAVGLCLLPKLVAWMEKNDQFRARRCLLSVAILAALWSHPELRAWLILSHTRVSLLSTLIYFLCIYSVMELFYILDQYPRLSFLKRFVFVVSRYTLALYIYHQGLGKLLEPYAVSMEVLTPLSIITGLFIGYVLQRAFFGLEKLFAGLRLIQKNQGSSISL